MASAAAALRGVELTHARHPRCPDVHPQGRLVDLAAHFPPHSQPAQPAQPALDAGSIALLSSLLGPNANIMSSLFPQGLVQDATQLLAALGNVQVPSLSPDSIKYSDPALIQHLVQQTFTTSPSPSQSVSSTNASEISLLEALLGRGYGHAEATKHILGHAVKVDGQTVSDVRTNACLIWAHGLAGSRGG